MKSIVRRACWGAACIVLVGGADAQTASQVISSQFSGGPAAVQAPPTARRAALSDQESATLREALDAAQGGNIDRARVLQASLTDPVARKLVLWAMADSAADRLSFFELDQARRDLWGWPRPMRRQAAAEKQLEAQAMSPQLTIDWFKGVDPITPEGAMALAAADRATGHTGDASKLIKHFWRDKVFEADAQRAMLARFADYLTVEDHIRRTDMLLYGQQGPAARDMLALLPPDQKAVAETRMAYRSGERGADLMLERLPPSLADSPGLVFERARYLRRRGESAQALALLHALPTTTPGDDVNSSVWSERRALVGLALAAHDYSAAYAAAAHTGLAPGVDYAEAEFYAGWLALTKLKNPTLADQHFAHIQDVGTSPITQSRALYWRGRSAEAAGDQIGAKDFYSQASQYTTTFYGQLAAERSGQGEFSIGHDPAPTPADRARFEGRESIQAARFLADAGEKDLFKSFVLNIDDTLPNAEEYVLLVDLAKGYGDQDLSMRVARVAAQRGYVLPDRAYPTVAAPVRDGNTPELALVFSITRAESNFDPRQRSAPGARGMMQLMPSTASHVARNLGLNFSTAMLEDPDYNMRLGSAYLGSMINSFGGSYVMAAASYNAGPNHMPDWTAMCGDPRSSGSDPVDFIECIPFSETRNYVMRVMESMEVYRARLNGGHAPLTLSKDLKRGSYVPGETPFIALSNGPAGAAGNTGAPTGTMAPIPD